MPSLTPLLLLASLLPLALAHEQTPMEENDWASTHMASEHHINGFDASSFFNLHDYDSDGAWEPAEILRTHGLAPGSTDGTGGPGAQYADGRGVEDYRRDEIVADVLARFDADRNGRIEPDEWSAAWARGERLKDWGIGPGHHGDDEYEYEIHHYEKYHDENTREEDLTHPEDIAHFRSHDQMDDEAYAQARLDRLSIVEHNIPPMFRRNQ